MKHRLFALAAAAVMALGLTACGGGGSSEGRGDDAYAYPITTDMETYTEVEPVGENQLPGTYPMAVDEERSGELVYEVPSGFTDFSIAYLEQFVDDSGEESTGETFFVYFTAEDQTGASA